MKLALSTMVLSIGLVGVAEAAPITWGTAQNTAGPSDIVSGGAVVLAWDGANVGAASAQATDPIINGISFTSDDFLGDSTGFNNALTTNTSGDAAYDALLTQNSFGGGTDTGLTLNGLAFGQDYFIQVWYIDTRPNNVGRIMTFGDGEPIENTVDLAADPSGTSNSLGQFVIGSFTADATSQTLHMLTNGFGNAHFAGVLVREVPEPGSVALLGLGGLMMLRRRRA